MAQQIPINESTETGIEIPEEGVFEIAPDLAYRRLALVNIMLFGQPHQPEWVLIDAGLPGTAGIIARTAEARFATDGPPAAILLTHGHFDHVGALTTLAERWGVPIYAHPLEHPYLDGTTAYPKPDAHVGGGIMSMLAPLYPRGPLSVSLWLRAYPQDGTVPHMPGWRWIHTPGHSVGHVSFWRESDRCLIAGDAFITTAQESAYAVTVQEPELHGPPMYFTHDWQAARDSVQRLAKLAPEVVVTGHGRAMHGEAMRTALNRLATDFDRVAVPKDGRYVNQPQTAADGSAYPGRN
ncbi:MBL fold metallo-hydrolase [Rhodopila sp.]|uniref:MBL fold metallo-hydrolase n=1 Tax=Rhodopila sp. TaxID=2480087 RepID=UPI003D11F275